MGNVVIESNAKALDLLLEKVHRERGYDFRDYKLGNFDIQIYATDINRQALEEAQAGVYSPKDIENLPHDVLENYFTRSEEGYIVNSEVRQMVCFSYFDLTSTIKQPFMDRTAYSAAMS